MLDGRTQDYLMAYDSQCFSLGQEERENPKSQTRNPKEIPSPKSEGRAGFE
jgi:hypothetical protein